MKSSRILIEKVKEFEGFRGRAYKCPGGIWTIGYGHTKDVKQGDKISEAEADRLLRKDLITFEAFVDSLNVTVKQYKFDALVDFCYNLGCTALENSTLLRKIRSCRPDDEIRSEFIRWVYSGKKKLPGLEKRRKWEADRFFNLV